MDAEPMQDLERSIQAVQKARVSIRQATGMAEDINVRLSRLNRYLTINYVLAEQNTRLALAHLTYAARYRH
jgi:hypothetical protein